MGLRTFEDEQGNQWQVWDVHPTTVERRMNAPEGFPESVDRRQTNQARFNLPPSLREGWLAFQHGDDSRRLSPIPPNWESTDDNRLLELLRSATPAPRRMRSLG